MPGKIKVKVLAGRNLPVMDRAGDTTDAFVEIKFGGVTHKTDVCRKSLNPHWSSTEWYRFEVDESELQDEPLQLRLMDHDTYSANDAIGKVVISLAPLLAREVNNTKATTAPQGGAVLSGWIPVFDTMHGIRGELNVIVKVELFSDFNKYKTSSCGVQFFHCPKIPPGYRATSIHGFVEELVVNDDPEYQWIDKIRTPRASNEARQVAFIKLSNQVQRLVGLKAAELGANAVVGYQQDFDLEGEAGVVARAIGTAVSISPVPLPSQPVNIPPCTQQQLKKYLDILATDDNITDLNQYYQTHQEELQKLLTILNPKTPTLLDETDNVDDDDKSVLTRQSSVKSYSGTLSIYQNDYISQKSLKHIADDQTDLNRLLNRVDEDESSSGQAMKKIKKLKTNFFLKRLGSIRSKKSEKQEDQISIKSNSSDTSRISIKDIKNEIKKFRRMKKPKFRKSYSKTQDQGIGMASILARSVIHVHTSLACIAETQDSEHSPSSTMRRTSESEPTIINKSEVDKSKITSTDNCCKSDSVEFDCSDIPEIRFTSLKNINYDDCESPSVHRKLSESCPSTPLACRNDNFLKLPGEAGYFGSVSSALSGESSDIYSSSDEEDESSDLKTDTEKSIETTSSIVRSVMCHEIDPTFVAQMDRKLSVVKTGNTEISPSNIQKPCNPEESSSHMVTNAEAHGVIIPNQERSKVKNLQTKTDKDNIFVAPKSHNHNFKFHNPFVHKKTESMSVPSSPIQTKSFVYRSSKRLKDQLSKFSKSDMMKSLSHYSLNSKKRQVQTKAALSQPSSSSDVTSKATPSETVLGSPFLSYADLLSLDKEGGETLQKINKSDDLHQHGPKVSMYIGSEPVSRTSLTGTDDIRIHNSHKKEKSTLKPTGLVHTAIETILMDKVQSLLIPTSPEPVNVHKKFFDDVTEKLEKVEEERKSNLNLASSYSIIANTHPVSTLPTESNDMHETHLESSGFINSLIPPEKYNTNIEKTVNAENEPTGSISAKIVESDKASTRALYEHNFGDVTKTNQEKSKSLTHLPIGSSLVDKMHTLFRGNGHNKSLENTVSPSDDKKDPGLIQTAVETMLIDKFQSLLPKAEQDNKDVKPSLDENGSIIKERKLIRQDSVQSESDIESPNMSKELEVITCKLAHVPVLQHFHPIRSGAALETIPSLPETSFDRTESLDVEGVQCDCICQVCGSIDANNASVCGNSHAACGVCRCERERDKGDRDKGDKGSPRHARHESYGSREPVIATPHAQNSSSNASSTPMGIHRRSSDSDLSITPKGSSLTTSAANTGSGGGAILRPSMNSNNLEMLEYPFLTMAEYPVGFIVHIGGTVCARSVKLVDGGGVHT
ncbi:hypothetical protein ACJJTC_017245 [Scirpophaga incertulas]